MTDPSVNHTAGATIVNKKGLHARAAAKVTRLAKSFDCDMTISRNDTTVPAASLMGLLTLAAARGKEIIINATGVEAAAALIAMVDLVESGFGEDKGEPT